MCNHVFQQNLEYKKSPHPGRPYLIRLLFKKSMPMLEKAAMIGVMEQHIGRVEYFCYDKKTAGLATLYHISEFKDAKTPCS